MIENCVAVYRKVFSSPDNERPDVIFVPMQLPVISDLPEEFDVTILNVQSYNTLWVRPKSEQNAYFRMRREMEAKYDNHANQIEPYLNDLMVGRVFGASMHPIQRVIILGTLDSFYFDVWCMDEARTARVRITQLFKLDKNYTDRPTSVMRVKLVGYTVEEDRKYKMEKFTRKMTHNLQGKVKIVRRDNDRALIYGRVWLRRSVGELRTVLARLALTDSVL